MNRYLLIALSLFFCTNIYANNQVLVLSGGDNPGLNHYSQYLQTKNIYEFLQSQYPNQVSIFFGAGNNPKTTQPLLDVHKVEKTDANKNDVMIAGILENNQAATKANISSYFYQPLIQNLTANDNLLMFVSDHGLPNQFMENKDANAFSDNCIDLWHFDGNIINNFADKDQFYKICLSKNELSTLLKPIKAKHIIFEMSQCFSGGFHQLSVTERNGYPFSEGHICGFTSAPPDHYASGCTADVSGPSYQGYERSFTEWFTGKSIPTGETLRTPAKNILTAHQHAVLEDLTSDIPLTTSDYYLWQWANAFEASDFKSRIKTIDSKKIQQLYKNYRNNINNISDKDFQEFRNLVLADSKIIKNKYPQHQFFFTLSLLEQQKYIEQQEKLIDEIGNNFSTELEGMRNIYQNIILPNWFDAIKNHQVTLTAKQLQMENDFYTYINNNHLYNYLYQFNALYAQFLSIQNNDREFVDYQQDRYRMMMEWAESKNLSAFKNAVQSYANFEKNYDAVSEKLQDAEKEKQLLKRIYIYNKIIAAWATLIKINDTQALHELNALISCEKSA